MNININTGDHVITNRGNHGKVICVYPSNADVKIGNNTYKIDLVNLTNITDGTLIEVEYQVKEDVVKTTVFLKHGTTLYKNGVEKVTTILKSQLKIDLKVLTIKIP